MPALPHRIWRYRRQFLRAVRDDEVRRGVRRPRTMREFEIMLAGFAERETRMALRTERAARRQQPPQDGRQSVTAEYLPDDATAGDAARWMADCLGRDGRSRRTRRSSWPRGSGRGFTFVTANGHVAISKPVLRAFRQAAGEPSWGQRSLCWLPRTEDDARDTPV